MKSRKRTAVDGGEGLGQTPFENLDATRFPAGGKEAVPRDSGNRAEPERESRARRVDVSRQKKGRGGKTVTVIAGLDFLEPGERASLAGELRRELGVGGAVRGAAIELQGDQREALMVRLPARGFRPVLAGG